MCEDRYNPWKLSPNVLERFFIGIPGRCNMCTQKPARRESKAVCTHTNSVIASYPREFSFKKGRRESVSSLFSSLIIGSRRTYSSKENSVLHTKVMPFTCFLSPREKKITDSVPSEKVGAVPKNTAWQPLTKRSAWNADITDTAERQQLSGDTSQMCHN